MTGLWTEVCSLWPTTEMLGEGYTIVCRRGIVLAHSPAAQKPRFSHGQSRCVRLTTIAALLEWHSDWGEKRATTTRS